jgi:hypothetical protein
MNCDDTLYNLIKRTPIRLECSIKNETDGRYTITLLLSEWHSMNKSEQDNILHYLHFTREQLNEILTEHSAKINRDTDIIFGVAPGIGKIYLDFDGSLVCYESTGKVKYYYASEKNPNVLNVSVDNKVIGQHTRVLDKLHYRSYPVFWIGSDMSNQSKNLNLPLTFYVRPASAGYLTNLIDLCCLCRRAIGFL